MTHSPTYAERIFHRLSELVNVHYVFLPLWLQVSFFVRLNFIWLDFIKMSFYDATLIIWMR